MSDLEEAIEESLSYAKKQVEQVKERGDPATHVSAEVDGRTGAARSMQGEVYETEYGTVQVREDYNIHISNLVSGTDIQNHKKKIKMYRAFGEKMEELGFNIGLEVKTYAR